MPWRTRCALFVESGHRVPGGQPCRSAPPRLRSPLRASLPRIRPPTDCCDLLISGRLHADAESTLASSRYGQQLTNCDTSGRALPAAHQPHRRHAWAGARGRPPRLRALGHRGVPQRRDAERPRHVLSGRVPLRVRRSGSSDTKILNAMRLPAVSPSLVPARGTADRPIRAARMGPVRRPVPRLGSAGTRPREGQRRAREARATAETFPTQSDPDRQAASPLRSVPVGDRGRRRTFLQAPGCSARQPN